jgi:DNA-binding NarL/FixJ family response regulator
MEKTVLIIDDDPVYLKFMQGHFSQLQGFKTEVCATGDIGLAKLTSIQPYLVILDHHLNDPHRDGIFYLKEIRKRNPKVPVVYITIDTSAELKTKVSKLNVQGFIYKNEAFLVYLRTALDEIEAGLTKKEGKGFLMKLFS